MSGDYIKSGSLKHWAVWLYGVAVGFALGVLTVALCFPARADDQLQCIQRYWYQVCASPDGTRWQQCNFNNDGMCYPASPPPVPIPGLPAPAGAVPAP